MNRRGFTLIELMVAVLLLALLSGGAVLSFRQPFNALRADSAAMTLKQFDADARAAARASGRPQRMVFDLPHRRFQRLDGDNFKNLRRQVYVNVGDCRIDIENQPQLSPSIFIDVSPNGWSRSYSFQLQNHSLKIAGLTGQITERP